MCRINVAAVLFHTVESSYVFLALFVQCVFQWMSERIITFTVRNNNTVSHTSQQMSEDQQNAGNQEGTKSQDFIVSIVAGSISKAPGRDHNVTRDAGQKRRRPSALVTSLQSAAQ